MTIQDCLEYCLKQNGLDYCKNCGLNIEMLNKALAEERERVRGILSDENYKLEEWYCSSLRPATLTHYEANQRNMKTRNEIEQLISFPKDKPLTVK